jgi:hypothetical protein
VRQRCGDDGVITPPTVGDGTTPPAVGDETAGGDRPERSPRWARVVTGAVAALCVTTALTHVLLMFLHVAPANPISQRYGAQTDAWIYPLFEQNWRLFAPEPESTRTQIFARTGRITASGEKQVSDWIDVSSVDNADTRHNPYPSRTTQNMIRLAWVNYLNTHGDDDVSRGDWAVLRAKYLRNLAAQRAGERSPHAFQAIRLKVVTRPIAAPGADGTVGADPYVRLLPWWNVTPDGN